MITLVPVTTLANAQIMREIRNSCREFMTRDPREISYEDQEHWFQTLDRTNVWPSLLWRTDDADGSTFAIGYGLVRVIDGRWWISGGLLPAWRGMGLGKRLFAELTAFVHSRGRTAWLEVRDDNSRAERVYRSLGYAVDLETRLDVITMYREPDGHSARATPIKALTRAEPDQISKLRQLYVSCRGHGFQHLVSGPCDVRYCDRCQLEKALGL